MGFVKVVKNKAYFKRYQVKFRRRRECKTDFYARKRLIIQDKNKYATPKYRFVVRFTNRDIITQIFSAELDHDKCIAAAYAHELQRYGIKFGLTNYAAAYATGLLLARRVNTKFGLSYEGQTEVDGEDFNVDHDPEGNAPFKALLDVGLKRTTCGARIFGALKGACDGGIDIPHNDRRFPGSKKTDGKEWEASPEVHRKYIFGGHVAEYMRHLAENDEERLGKQFKRFVDAKIKADDIEGIYTKAHAAIRKDPMKKRDPLECGSYAPKRKTPAAKKEGTPKRYGRTKASIEQRMARIKQKLLAKGIKSLAPPKEKKVVEKKEKKVAAPAAKAAAPAAKAAPAAAKPAAKAAAPAAKAAPAAAKPAAKAAAPAAKPAAKK